MAGVAGVMSGLRLGGDEFDFDQELGSHELGNDEQH
jgi:hypothetical protein